MLYIVYKSKKTEDSYKKKILTVHGFSLPQFGNFVLFAMGNELCVRETNIAFVETFVIHGVQE